MKVWLDDIRVAPDGWVWVKTVDDAIARLINDDVTHISLDNDLGENQPEGRKVVLYMAEHNIWPEIVTVHSANPVAVEYMNGMIKRYKP
jgi:hypothetical protein